MNSSVEYFEKELTAKIIGLAIDVHKNLGPGLLESIYRDCLAYELAKAKVPFTKEEELPVIYKGERLPTKYRLDLFIDRRVIVELKSVEVMNPLFTAQVLTYLKLTKCKIGLLINFNVPLLKDGIIRLAC
jgi:GxxExxY protein